MNILILCAQGGVAGSTYSISYLAKGLAEKKHNVYLGLLKGSFLDSLVKDSTVKRVYMPFNGKTDKKTRSIIKELIEQENIHIINAQSSNDRYVGPLINFLNGKNVKIIQTRRQNPKKMIGLNKFFQNIFNNYFCDHLVVVSEALKQIFIERGIHANKLKVIHNGTPTDQYQPNLELRKKLQNELGYSDQDIVIGCVARYKNQPQLVKALQLLPKEWKVLYVGLDEENYRNRFPNEPDIHDVPQEVKCLGIVNDKSAVIQYYTLMTVNVLPSTMDGFGLTLVESMAMNTPVVATNFAGIPDVVQHEENGLLYENENYEDFANQIKRAVEDQELRKKLLENGRKTAFNTFSIENTINKYETFFEEILHS
ncbi:Glycosyltransferase involved in cell wall bisynthesis [Marivirga sericea]|uniref:Glycosyltransferase involved in cell wall bisynthesis n=1 Tax=Marivirga sericea TaxID=1028 RepID=A0A1X7L9W4_9BACT|nr:glycosyltransferase family 4 protein [Marivirga sericea]SMG50500.1 Glycosyltransferase involved in cell wall bisynthesis [Marivirga sericea]